MQVRELMSQPVVVVNPTVTTRDASKRMRDEKIGAMPVVPVGDDVHVIGMITDRDIVVRANAENRLPSNTSVSTVMSENVYCCFDDASVEEAAQLMAEHQVRRLPVLNHEDQLVGIVALADIARSGVKEAEVLALEQISQPSDRPRR